MLIAQEALISHLEAQFPSYTVDGYAGQIADANKLTKILPAALVMYISGNPMAQEPLHRFDLITVEKSDILKSKAAKASNLAFTAELMDFLKANFTFHPAAGAGSFAIIREQVEARMILQDPKFTIMAVTLPIKSV